MKTRSKSISVLNFQNLMKKSDTSPSNTFVPFVKERNLGKLITDNASHKKGSNAIESISFKNFKAIYRREAKQEEARYSKLTRDSEQRDLFANKGWEAKKIFTLSQNRQWEGERLGRNCCSESQPKLPVVRENKFEKSDENAYKKIMKEKPAGENPEIMTLFQHYAEVCELNENIRREELVRKRKI